MFFWHSVFGNTENRVFRAPFLLWEISESWMTVLLPAAAAKTVTWYFKSWKSNMIWVSIQACGWMLWPLTCVCVGDHACEGWKRIWVVLPFQSLPYLSETEYVTENTACLTGSQQVPVIFPQTPHNHHSAGVRHTGNICDVNSGPLACAACVLGCTALNHPPSLQKSAY